MNDIAPPFRTLLPAPDLLVRPMPSRREGPLGYLLRLAEANCLTLRELEELGARYEQEWLSQNHLLPDPLLDQDLHAHVHRMSRLVQDKGRIWNRRQPRYCPLCLSEEPIWQANWEVIFHDVCPAHGVWLLDQCSSCHRPLKWNRESLLRCECGADLRAESPQVAPGNAQQLSAILEARLLERPVTPDMAPLSGMNLEQTQRLIRYLGGYMDPVSGPKPLKLRNAWQMQASWPVSSLAAEILAQWPQAFHQCWARMQEYIEGDKVGLSGTFKQAHFYLYKGLKESAFLPIREAFETWLSEEWKGGLCRRNRRLTTQLLANAQWIPGKVAADHLGISVPRLRVLLKEGLLDGQESISATGRRFLMVRRDQLDQISAHLANEMTMTAAMELLGIGKIRLRKLLTLLFPGVRRIANKDKMPWCVPRGEVELLLAIGNDLPVVSIPDEHQVSLAHVLKYWTWTGEEIVSLVEEVRTGNLVPLALLDSAKGISRWIFDAKRLRNWQASLKRGLDYAWLSIPQVAEVLRIKQQVAYWLTRNGYLPTTEKLSTSQKAGAHVRREDIDRFRDRYVFGREIAAKLRCSSRKLSSILAEHGFHPLLGNGVEPSRQLIYKRSNALQRFLLETEGVPAENFELGS